MVRRYDLFESVAGHIFWIRKAVSLPRTVPKRIVLLSKSKTLPVILISKFIFFQQYSIKRTAVMGLFALYLSAVFSATGIPDVSSLTPDFSFNLIPFIDMANDPAGYLKNSLLNILLFIPLGFLLPAVWREYRTLKKTAFAGFALSLVIEILQIFTFRLTDVDDLITNTAGALAGYFLAKTCLGKVWQKPLESEGLTDRKYEPILIFAVVLFLMFFIHPSVSNVLWNLQSCLLFYLHILYRP